jgi:hypothetical protein
MTKGLTAVLVAAFAMAVPARAPAAEWQWKVTPYLWAMGIDGDIGARGVTAPIDVKFTDAVENLDFGGMLFAEANNGDWGILFDGAYLKLSDDGNTAVGPVSAEVEEWILQGAAVHRVVKNEKTMVDAGVGGRFMNLDTDVSAAGVDASATENWADPLLVIRVRQQFATHCFGMLVGDIGGFGVASDLTWQLTAAAGYSFTDNISMLIGYRHLDYDYEDNGVIYDAAASGFALGLQFDL